MEARQYLQERKATSFRCADHQQVEVRHCIGLDAEARLAAPGWVSCCLLEENLRHSTRSEAKGPSERPVPNDMGLKSEKN